MAILLPSSVESGGGGICHHLLEERRSAQFWKGMHLKLPTDVLVRGRSHDLILMVNLAMAGGLPFYS